MYLLKQVPSDFIVRERSSVEFAEKGAYVYFELSKENWNTIDVIRKTAQYLGVAEREVGFAGIKDRHAVTTQFCSVRAGFACKLESLTLEGVSLCVVGYGNESIRTGNLLGNEFSITLRNLEKGEIPKKIEYFPNYFDEQRFSEKNVEIGRYLLQKKFLEAAQGIDRVEVNASLAKDPRNAVGALQKVSLRILKLYTHAFQSYIWNRTLAEYVLRKGEQVREATYSEGVLRFATNVSVFKDLMIPLIGFDQTLCTEELINIITEEILREEGLGRNDFVIKQIPDLSLEGGERAAFVPVEDLWIGSVENDELHVGKKKCQVSFFLGKGSYATMVVRAMMG